MIELNFVLFEFSMFEKVKLFLVCVIKYLEENVVFWYDEFEVLNEEKEDCWFWYF